MAEPKKMPNGKWRIRVYDGKENGKKIYKCFTADTKSAVKMAVSQYLVNREKNGSSKLLLGDAMDAFIENRRAVLSPASVASYISIRKNAFPTIINTAVSSLTPEKIQMAISSYSANHSPKTTRNVSAFLSAVLAVYAPNMRYSVDLPKMMKKEKLIPTNEDVDIICESAKGTPLFLPILLASKMGLRRSEICALTCADFDKEKQRITINKAVVRDEYGKYVVKPPKSYSGYRVLRIPQVVMSHIPQQDPVITLTPNQISDSFDSLIRRLNMPNYTFHSLRHYYASVMLALKVPDKYAMEIMGHSTDHMLKSVYQHTFADNKNKILDVVDNFFGK